MISGVMNRRKLLLTAIAVAAARSRARAGNGTIQVTVENLTFTPAKVEAQIGETIEWTNKDPFDHTATVDGEWEVAIPVGEKGLHLVTANDTGKYYCRFHPNMQGQIKVVT